MKAGADINKPNPDGVTPLINALDNKHFDIAMFLLDKGAEPEHLGHERPHARSTWRWT